MLWPAGARARNDGNLDRALDHADQLEIVALILPVAVDRVQQDLARAHGLARRHELHHVQVARLAAPAHRARVPHVLAARLRVGQGGFQRRVGGVTGGLDKHALRVDADHDGLPPVRGADRLDASLAAQFAAGGKVLLRGGHSIAPDTHLVRPGREIQLRDVQRTHLLARPRVHRVPDPAPDRQRHEHRLAGPPQDLQHR